MDELEIGDKVYISSKKAAQITGYAKDYVGQLCREGRVEARLVGRNWYVLESAIRAHRFGEVASAEPLETHAPAEEASEATVEAPETVPASPVETWEQPRYAPEAPAYMPEIPVRTSRESVIEPERSLTDMQNAWKEWFAAREGAEASNESSSGGDARVSEEVMIQAVEEEVIEEVPEEEEEVVLNRLQEPSDAFQEADEEEEAVILHRTHESRADGEVVPKTHPVIDLSRTVEPAPLSDLPVRTHKKPGTSLAVRAIFFAVALVSAVIALIGTGLAETMFKTNLHHGVSGGAVDFLTGTKSFDKQ